MRQGQTERRRGKGKKGKVLELEIPLASIWACSKDLKKNPNSAHVIQDFRADKKFTTHW